jgi:uncharacterized membrane protein
MKNALYVFLISILPLIELRGAVPVGAAMGIPFYITFLAAVVGNVLPVPFILMFIPKILDFMARFKIFRPIVEWLRKKANKNRGKIIKDDEIIPGGEHRMSGAIFTALLLFVALPVPGTGAWTGSLVAATIRMNFWRAMLSALLGVMIAGVIVTLICLGVSSGIEWLSFLI